MSSNLEESISGLKQFQLQTTLGIELQLPAKRQKHSTNYGHAKKLEVAYLFFRYKIEWSSRKAIFR